MELIAAVGRAMRRAGIPLVALDQRYLTSGEVDALRVAYHGGYGPADSHIPPQPSNPKETA
jgi:hypothetical protein